MTNSQSGDNFVEKHLIDKRNELIYAISLQNYTDAQIGRMFNLNRSTIMRIIKGKPTGWKPKWIKGQN